MNEQEHHKKAFEFYYSLGESRNYNLVAKEFGVSMGAVKTWGRTFSWKHRVAERDVEAARAIADRGMKDSVERGVRNRKLVEMGLVKVAQAIAEGKAKVTVADLDRLIRLEEYLREDLKKGITTIVLDWRDADDPSRKQDEGSEEPENEGQ